MHAKRIWTVCTSALVLVFAGFALAAPASAVDPVSVALPSVPDAESEPNDTIADADPLASGDRVRGAIRPGTDADLYSFSAPAGGLVYAAVMTSGSGTLVTDSALDLIAPDGTTVLETDLDDGAFGTLSSSIAGASTGAAGTYYLRVRHQGTGEIAPYDLYLRVRATAGSAESEPNPIGTPQPLPAQGGVTGTIDPALDTDVYSIELDAGDTVFLSLDRDPERDATTFAGRVGFGLFGSPPGIQVAGDAVAGAPASSAYFTTVRDAGTYLIHVDDSASVGGPSSTYRLSANVVPAMPESCRVYDSTAPVAIPTGPGMASSAISVPDGFEIGRAALALNIDHNFMADLDVELQTPAGNSIVPITDVGSTTAGSQTQMRITLDDAAALPPVFASLGPAIVQAEGGPSMRWMEGEQASGNWTVVVRDDATGDGGTLNSWSLILCEAEQPEPATTTLYEADFESGADGFTHSGTADEWELGTPSLAPITTCASGTQCWKTDLDGGYDASSSQDLLSPPIQIPADPDQQVIASWMQRFQMESVRFDHMFVDVQEVGGANPTRLYEWEGRTMNANVGNPITAIQESAGWSRVRGDISEYAGKQVELRFHVDGDTSVHLSGLAVDDVLVDSRPEPVTPPPPGGGGGGPAALADHARELTLKLKGHLKAKGKLSAADGFAACVADQKVELQRKKGSKYKRVKRATTKPNGSYKVKLKDHAGKYRAFIAESATATDRCAEATSKKVKHKD